MKQWKPGLLLQGVPLIVRALLPGLDAVSQLILVGGYQFEELKRLVMGSDRISVVQKAKITFVENKEYSTGMFSSVQLGVSQVQSSLLGTYIVPGDMPRIDVETYNILASALAAERGADIYIPAIQTEADEKSGEKRLKKGHPILVRQRVFSRIHGENRTAILRDVLKQFQSQTLVVSDTGICVDIDEEGDVAKIDLNTPTIRYQKNGSTL